MDFLYSAAFESLYRRLPAARKASAAKALLAMEKMLRENQPAPSLGLRELCSGFWEVRAGLLDRIVFSMDAGAVRLLAVGSHDELRRFLQGR